MVTKNITEVISEVISSEHSVSHLSICNLGGDEMIQYFGKGLKSYFDFIKFSGIVNLFLFLTTFSFSIGLYLGEKSDNDVSNSFVSRCGFQFQLERILYFHFHYFYNFIDSNVVLVSITTHFVGIAK